MKNRIILFVIVLLGCVTALKAQNREYSAEIDTNYILIGDPEKLPEAEGG